MAILVLVRHGESQWNLENRFTGWTDIPLSERGRKEAEEAGQKLKDYRFEAAYTSVLVRAIDTLSIILEATGQKDLPIFKDQALNERHYGDLQGLNKDDIRDKFGAEQLKLWRRSYDVRPPGGESLADTAARVLPYWDRNIFPRIRKGEDLLVVAHGNSLRALVMHLDHLSKEEVVELNIPTGVPRRYVFNQQGEIASREYL